MRHIHTKENKSTYMVADTYILYVCIEFDTVMIEGQYTAAQNKKHPKMFHKFLFFCLVPFCLLWSVLMT